MSHVHSYSSTFWHKSTNNNTHQVQLQKISISVTSTIYFKMRAVAVSPSEEVYCMLICCLTTKLVHAFEKTNKFMQAISSIYLTGNENSLFVAVRPQLEFLTCDDVTEILRLDKNTEASTTLNLLYFNFVDQTAKCVAIFYYCQGAFGRTK